MMLGFWVSTYKFRGSQKSKSVAERVVLDREIGDGEGEREGQELMERRSEAWLAVAEGGWINTTDTTKLEPRHFNFASDFLESTIINHTLIVVKDRKRVENLCNIPGVNGGE